jgi:predicted protein tyrosine phosphatase
VRVALGWAKMAVVAAQNPREKMDREFQVLAKSVRLIPIVYSNLIPIVYNSNVAGAGEERVERYYCTEERTPWRAR